MKPIRERKNNRWRDFDYNQGGYYYVTICTDDRKCFFGDVTNSKMVLSEIGNIANKCWRAIPNHFPDAQIDEYIIMPNHVHGIVAITNIPAHVGVASPYVGNADLRSLHMERFCYDRTKMRLPKIIHGFKSSVTRIIGREFPTLYFDWQKSYHDRIIRNNAALNHARQYILLNPMMWDFDRNNPFKQKKGKVLQTI